MKESIEKLLENSELMRRELQEKLLLAEKHAQRLQKLLDEQQLQLNRMAEREQKVSEREQALSERLHGKTSQDYGWVPFFVNPLVKK